MWPTLAGSSVGARGYDDLVGQQDGYPELLPRRVRDPRGGRHQEVTHGGAPPAHDQRDEFVGRQAGTVDVDSTVAPGEHAVLVEYAMRTSWIGPGSYRQLTAPSTFVIGRTTTSITADAEHDTEVWEHWLRRTHHTVHIPASKPTPHCRALYVHSRQPAPPTPRSVRPSEIPRRRGLVPRTSGPLGQVCDSRTSFNVARSAAVWREKIFSTKG